MNYKACKKFEIVDFPLKLSKTVLIVNIILFVRVRVSLVNVEGHCRIVTNKTPEIVAKAFSSHSLSKAEVLQNYTEVSLTNGEQIKEKVVSYESSETKTTNVQSFQTRWLCDHTSLVAL